MPYATGTERVTSADFWGTDPSPLIYRAHKLLVRGQLGGRKRLLKPTFDRKVNPDGWYQVSEDRWVPELPNALSLLAVKTCHSATDYCKSICYALRMENMPGVYELYKHNTELLRAADLDGKIWLLSELMGSYVFNAVHKQLKPRDRIFRWHPSGDFDSLEYAEAAATVMPVYPGINNYVYTRAFHGAINVIPILIKVPNLALYISVDPDNMEPAREVFAEYADQGLMLAPTGRDYETTREVHAYVAAGAKRRVAACPENNKANPMGLMDDHRGACVRCLWCPEKKTDVMFAETGKEFADAPLRQQALTEVRVETPTVRKPKAPTVPPPQRHQEITEPMQFRTVDDLEQIETQS